MEMDEKKYVEIWFTIEKYSLLHIVSGQNKALNSSALLYSSGVPFFCPDTLSNLDPVLPCPAALVKSHSSFTYYWAGGHRTHPRTAACVLLTLFEMFSAHSCSKGPQWEYHQQRQLTVWPLRVSSVDEVGPQKWFLEALLKSMASVWPVSVTMVGTASKWWHFRARTLLEETATTWDFPWAAVSSPKKTANLSPKGLKTCRVT